MKTGRTLCASLGVLALLGAAIFAMATPASAASLQEVTNFGTNPSSLRMFVYIPASVAARPPVVVAVHYCHGDGPAFYAGSDFARLADQYGFIVIYPSVTLASDGCFDVASAAALRRDGGSDPVGIMSMVTYAEQHFNGDPNRVYATGVSSGAMMTNVLLGDYPDVFKAGSAFAGVPFACFAGPNSWNSDCASGLITKTPAQWGDLVRAANPGYTGARPRMQLWHGTADETLNYVNFGEEIKQWTNVLGVSQTPTSTDTPQSGWTRTRYANSSGVVQVEATSMAGVPHNLPVQAAAAIHFFGLDVAGPTATATGTTRPPTTAPTTTPVTTPPVTSTPATTPPPGGGGSCSAVYTVASSWAGGFVASVRVTASGAAINGWRVTLSLPSGTAITNIWNGQASATTGTVQVTNMPYNGKLAVGGSADFGFQANGSGTGVTATCTAS
jgi:acetylxylan esterase